MQVSLEGKDKLAFVIYLAFVAVCTKHNISSEEISESILNVAARFKIKDEEIMPILIFAIKYLTNTDLKQHSVEMVESIFDAKLH